MAKKNINARIAAEISWAHTRRQKHPHSPGPRSVSPVASKDEVDPEVKLSSEERSPRRTTMVNTPTCSVYANAAPLQGPPESNNFGHPLSMVGSRT